MPGVESSSVLTSCAMLLRRLEVVAEDLDRQPAVAAAAAHAAHHVLLAAGRTGAHDDAGDARQLAAQLHGDLIVGALALVARHQPDVDVAAVRRAAAEAAATAAAVGLRDQHRRFRHRAA